MKITELLLEYSNLITQFKEIKPEAIPAIQFLLNHLHIDNTTTLTLANPGSATETSYIYAKFIILYDNAIVIQHKEPDSTSNKLSFDEVTFDEPTTLHTFELVRAVASDYFEREAPQKYGKLIDIWILHFKNQRSIHKNRRTRNRQENMDTLDRNAIKFGKMIYSPIFTNMLIKKIKVRAKRQFGKLEYYHIINEFLEEFNDKILTKADPSPMSPTLQDFSISFFTSMRQFIIRVEADSTDNDIRNMALDFLNRIADLIIKYIDSNIIDKDYSEWKGW